MAATSKAASSAASRRRFRSIGTAFDPANSEVIHGKLALALDGLLYLFAFAIVGILIHAHALFAMFKGFRACGERAEYLKEKILPI